MGPIQYHVLFKTLDFAIDLISIYLGLPPWLCMGLHITVKTIVKVFT